MLNYFDPNKIEVKCKLNVKNLLKQVTFPKDKVPEGEYIEATLEYFRTYKQVLIEVQLRDTSQAIGITALGNMGAWNIRVKFKRIFEKAVFSGSTVFQEVANMLKKDYYDDGVSQEYFRDYDHYSKLYDSGMLDDPFGTFM